MSWKNKTCAHCEFRVGAECRRLPPISGPPDKGYFALYPKVGASSPGRLYQALPACSFYSELPESENIDV